MAQNLTRLVTKAQKGNKKALSDLIAQCYDDLYYFAYKTLKNEDLAADITQESCIIILQKLCTLNDPGAFSAWTHQIVYHQCTHYFRDTKEVQPAENAEGETVFDTLADTNPAVLPEAAAEDREFQKIMQDLLNELPAEQRSALMLYYYEKLPVSEIASIQGVPSGTVKSRLNYGRKMVKTKVEDYEKKSGTRLHSAAILPVLLHLLFQTGKTETAKAGAALATGAAASIAGAAGVGIGSKIAVAAGLLVTFGVIGGVVGNHIVAPTPPPTTPTIMVAPTSSTATVSTTVPTTQTTTAPTVYVHPGPSNTDGELEYTPADIPEVYWKVLNNQEPICFPGGCTSHTRTCYAWLDDYRFPYLFDEIAASENVTYALIDMDGDGKEELLIRDSDTLVLREKDGIVYGYSFIFRNMDAVYTDGTYTSYYGGNGVEVSRNQLSFDEDNYCGGKELCRSHDFDEFTSKFYINYAEVSKEEYMDYKNTLSNQKVVWNKLGRYPIHKEVIPPG